MGQRVFRFNWSKGQRMNERIKLLAEQAGITTNLDTDYFEKDINKWIDYYSEKFAELIVRECAEVCMKDIDNGWAMAPKSPWMAKQILEHFGVKE